MGICGSSEVRKSRNVSRAIERTIEKESQVVQVKLLLLGAAECGKSTLVKQMRLLHGDTFTEKEVEIQKSIIYSNMIYNMKDMLDACQTLNIVNCKDLEPNTDMLLAVTADRKQHDRFSDEIYQILKTLWATPQIQEAFKRRHEYQLSDGVSHFFDNIDRIYSSSFKPTTEDMLHVRVPTTGVVHITFRVQSMAFHVFDVGGQRTERRKWIHVFDDVNVIIFVVSLSEYDQVLMEDNKTNRMLEALTLFGQMCCHRYFSKVNMVLFLNKNDLFQQKIKLRPITSAFPDYEGGQEEEPSRQFIQQQFMEQNENKQRDLYCHVTCATDTNQVELIIKGVIDSIMQQNIKQSGFA